VERPGYSTAGRFRPPSTALLEPLLAKFDQPIRHHPTLHNLVTQPAGNLSMDRWSHPPMAIRLRGKTGRRATEMCVTATVSPLQPHQKAVGQHDRHCMAMEARPAPALVLIPAHLSFNFPMEQLDRIPAMGMPASSPKVAAAGRLLHVYFRSSDCPRVARSPSSHPICRWAPLVMPQQRPAIHGLRSHPLVPCRH
jgi:hypothetical protein